MNSQKDEKEKEREEKESDQGREAKKQSKIGRYILEEKEKREDRIKAWNIQIWGLEMKYRQIVVSLEKTRQREETSWSAKNESFKRKKISMLKSPLSLWVPLRN